MTQASDSLICTAPAGAAPPTSAQAHFRAHQQSIYVRTDRLFAWLMGIQWLAGIAAAIWISPRAWEGMSSSLHPHVWSAIVVGGVISLFPMLLVHLRPGWAGTRYAIATGQALMSALFIHLTGGRIETHFHVFGSLAILAGYRDWRVLIPATVVIALDHMLRGIFFPASVYGVLTASHWRWLEHAGWVVFEDIFLVIACVRSEREMWRIAERTAALESTQADLRRAMVQAEAGSRAKGEFLANMSHEIRTPMTAILGYADLLKDQALDNPEILEHVEVIRRDGRHLITLINDILDLSKIEAGKLTVDRMPCSPVNVVADVMSMMRVRSAEKGLSLGVEYRWPLPQTILTDPMRLRQTLVNLVGNAIKFTEAGGVRLVVSGPAVDDVKPVMTFEIIDTGVGIPADRLAEIFSPFVQADASTTRRFGGTGLGLTISRRLAQLLGGDITVVSTPEAGSTFTMTVETGALEAVPFVSRMSEASAALSRYEESPTQGPGPESLQGLHALLAEDTPSIRGLLETLLRRCGAQVVAVENGLRACERMAAERDAGGAFDVVLLDMQMPELDGYAAARRLRAQGYRGPIVALTANAMKEDRQRCLASGCSAYLSKPVDVNELIRVLAPHANRTASDATTAAPTAPSAPTTPAVHAVANSDAADTTDTANTTATTDTADATTMADADAPPASRAPEPITPAPEPITPAAAPAMLKTTAKDPIVLEAIPTFLAQLPTQVEQLQAKLAANDFEALHSVLHQLTGAGGTYGFMPITDLARRAEQTLLTRDLADLTNQVQSLITLLASVEGYPTTPAPTASPRKRKPTTKRRPAAAKKKSRTSR